MIYLKNNRLYRRQDKELLCIEPWGSNSLRIRATQNRDFASEELSALLPAAEVEQKSEVTLDIAPEKDRATVVNGHISCRVTRSGKLIFRNGKGDVILEEFFRNRIGNDEENPYNSALEISPRELAPLQGTDNYAALLRFESNDDERFYGMGQYQQPYLNLKGCVMELAQRNSQASVPFALSSRGYGFLWNNPAIGKATFGKNLTEWSARSTKQIDYWITAGDTPAEIMEAYGNATGTVPMMPDYAMGFWQCKLRYQTQEELLEVAREYKRRGVPLSVIVADFFHWPFQGDWKFDPEYWPDPEAMTKELADMGVKLMVSIWPTVEKGSENFSELEERGFLTRTEAGSRMNQLGDACFFDATNPEARSYVWGKIKKNYYDKGIPLFWLDEAEPEFTDYEYSHYRYHLGSDLEVGNLYPRLYARMAYDGLREEGVDNPISLLRCAWAGSQRMGALVWSGDIDSSFRSLRYQLAAGLNMGLSGIPWWTTDIGGFHGGNIHDESFHECLVRWFQFGAFCPVFRLHGFREPFKEALSDSGGGRMFSGAENEIWSYGDKIYGICEKYIRLREVMRPYIKGVMEEAHKKGAPVMRPLFYDFPGDREAWDIEDQYMFGPDILVNPVLEERMTERSVYVPEGEWRHLLDGEIITGPKRVTLKSPLEYMPVLVRKGALPDLLW